MQHITLPQDIVSKQSLPSDVVHLWPVNELIAHEKGKTFKLAPDLTETHSSRGLFDQMKVSFAVERMSHKTACAIEKLVKKHVISPRALSTAWFFKIVNKWIDLICSRHPGMAFSLIRPEQHRQTSGGPGTMTAPSREELVQQNGTRAGDPAALTCKGREAAPSQHSADNALPDAKKHRHESTSGDATDNCHFQALWSAEIPMATTTTAPGTWPQHDEEDPNNGQTP
ncbi:hypothetical protein HPB47_013927 [Ixodes persulcatus]|uniref:Uncharacterized protein n=1 Tax=Ixodes persulcatus TaxID=34615 RepID=A0AC60QYN2_IXOPE|nr:hypothetical protein HPB47_013927 [Ixodes persulcatus]